jgi:hypothetical protein
LAPRVDEELHPQRDGDAGDRRRCHRRRRLASFLAWWN